MGRSPLMLVSFVPGYEFLLLNAKESLAGQGLLP
jgi:hypothetical protein